jgi:PBSX family phage terminase large subunit
VNNLVLSPKFKDFLTCYCEREYLEGTTAAGKTTVGIPKFMLRVAMSDKKDHVIAGADLGTVEKNIINSELGLLSQFEGLTEYYSNGKGKIRLPHIEYQTSKGVKIIYVCGYDNKAKWKKVLGSQVGCVFIDEVNICDMEFLREITHRCDYMMTTSNPDDPNLPVYKEFINKSRPLKKYIQDYPKELLDELNEPYVKGWVHWYFTFYDNASLTKEAIQKKIDAVPVGTKMYKNKIQGLRGRATGLVFSNFDRKRHVVSYVELKDYIANNKLRFNRFSCGVDTSYSNDSPDTISFIFQGILNNGKIIILDEEINNNRDLDQPLAPSDVVEHLISFLERNRKEWGFAMNVFVDSADQATLRQLDKYTSNNPCVYIFNNSWKSKLNIIDRIHAMLGWFKTDDYMILSHCKNHIHELEIYSWKEDKYEPEDKNDHTINASQYGWIPYTNEIGILKGG